MLECHGGILVGCVEATRLIWMLIKAQFNSKSPFHVSGGTVHIQNHFVWVCAGDHEVIGPREGQEELVVALRGTEPFGELLGREEMSILGAGGVVELRQEVR